MTSIFDKFEIFNSIFFYNWFENELFNQIANFFHHFQQCLHFYCESKLLDLLIIAFIDFVDTWFDDQSKFVSLHDFDIVFTKTFSSSESAKTSSIFISSKSSISQKQQKFDVSFEILRKVAKRAKRNVVKNAKRVKFKTLKTEQVAKSISIIQNIDIFDSIFTCENRRFSDFAKFLQHFQHCQHLYRESNLFILLSICLDDVAFDIWYKKQNVMTSTSLNEWIEILRVDFANVSFAKSKIICSKNICMRCDSNFNFKKKFREHVRKQHTKKLINNSSFSINTFKSVCENEKKSIFDDSSVSHVSQKFDIFIATFKQKFESVMIFETVISSKNFHLSINAVNLVCEIEKKSFVTHVSFVSFAKSQKLIFEFAIAFETVILLKRSTFQSFALETTSESTKRLSMCRHCKKIFNFKKMFR